MTPEYAYSLGRKAFYGDKFRVAVFDGAILAYVSRSEKKPTDDDSPILDAWLRGWDAANIEAMMEVKNGR